jgi:exodeoxyribonuclease VII large subunit
MVRDAEGAIVPSAVRARGAGHLRLAFADGEVPVTVADGDVPSPPAPSAAPTPKPARKPPAAPGRGQGELF